MKYCICLVLYCTLAFSAVWASSTERLSLSAPPSIWAQEDNGELVGPIIDLVATMFSQQKISITTRPLPWARAIEEMKTGQLDLMVVIFFTEERARFMDFSLPYVKVPTSVFVPKNKPFPFSSLEDLKDRRGVIVRDDSISKEFGEFEKNLNLEKVVSYDQILKMLESGRVDYAVAAQYGFLIHAKKLGYDKHIEYLPHPIAERNLHIAVSKKSPYKKYISHINQQIEHFRKDGTINHMVQKALENASKK